jgi:hypothetical protein
VRPRPQVALSWHWPDRALLTLGVGLLVAHAVLASWALARLPQIKPWPVLVVFVLGLVVFGALVLLTRVPHAYNYPWPITVENAERQYRTARRMVLAIQTVMTGLFLSISAEMVAHGVLGRRLTLRLVTWEIVVLFAVLVLHLGQAWSRR